MSGSTQASLIAASVSGVSDIFNQFTGEMGYLTSFQLPVNRGAMKAEQISNPGDRNAFAVELFDDLSLSIAKVLAFSGRRSSIGLGAFHRGSVFLVLLN